MTTPATPNPADQAFRRLFAGFDSPVEPPADLATRLRLRVLAEAELDDPVALRPVPAPVQAAEVAPVAAYRPSTSIARPSPDAATLRPAPLAPRSRADEVGTRRRRQPWWLVAAEAAAAILLLMGAAVVVIQRTVETDQTAPRLGSAITAVSGPSAEPQLLWERTDPDLFATGDLAAGDDLIVRSVYDEHKGGFLFWETYEYDHYVQALDRRTGDQRWLVPVDNFSSLSVVGDVVVSITFGSGDGQAITVVGLNAADGAERWQTQLPIPPAYATGFPELPNRVFVGSYDGRVVALDTGTGAQVWSAAIGRPPADGDTRYLATQSLVLDGDRLFTLDPTGAVVEIDPVTGEIAARHAASVALPKFVYGASLFVTRDRLVTLVTGTDDQIPEGGHSEENHPRVTSRVSAIDRVTGAAVWTEELAGNLGATTQADGRMVIESYDDHDEFVGPQSVTVRVLDLRTGDELWAQSEDRNIQAVSVERGTTEVDRFLVATHSGDLVALDIDTGRELWRFKVGDLIMMPPVVAGGLALVNDTPDHLVAVAIPEHGG